MDGSPDVRRLSLVDLALAVVAVAGLLFLTAPLLIVIPNAFSDGAYLVFPPPGFSLRWFQAFFASPLWTNATTTSFVVATTSAMIASIVGTAAALALEGWPFRGRSLLTLALVSPLLTPVVIIGIAAYQFFLAVNLYGSLVSLVLAHAVLGLPYVVISVAASLNQLDPRVRRAAHSLGAGSFRTFWEVTLPLIFPGAAAGAILAFIISFDDVVIATFLTGVRTTTLPMRMFQAASSEFDPTIAVASTMLIGLAVLMLAVTAVLERGQRRLRRPTVRDGDGRQSEASNV